MGKPTLGYWNIRGVVQPTRFLLNYLGVDFEEKRYDTTKPDHKETWLADKFTLGLDFPDLPYWIDGELKLTESRVLLKQIARKYGPHLVPATEALQLKSDMLENYVSDIQMHMSFFCYFVDGKDETENALYDNSFAVKVKNLSSFLGDKTWILGENLSYIDFLVYEIFLRLRKFKPQIVDPFPNLGEYVDRFEALPAIATYIKSPQYIPRPVFMPNAKQQPL